MVWLFVTLIRLSTLLNLFSKGRNLGRRRREAVG